VTGTGSAICAPFIADHHAGRHNDAGDSLDPNRRT
jgi:hypothetical protein